MDFAYIGNIALLILGFGFVIFWHELGHFLAAKWLGVYAPRFSIGFGPALWRRRFGETEYILAALPLGGFVRMASREDEATATYAFQPTRESVRGEQAQRYVDRLRGEFTLVKADSDISRIRLFTPEAFSPLPLVRVDRLNIDITCQTAPNGRRYAAESVTELRGSAFGQSFDERSVQRASNLR